ncbi:MAG TPA: hypothetical protein VE291_03910, partial [Terracidiphilus sp.]|nr:hypothetical protein [Terracidiphilus sp.]
DASNSSLTQILAQITTATGAKIDGAAADQRIFGSFGPGSARDVLTQLLQGSGYNILMVGDNGHGLPREIQLSMRSAGSSVPAAARPPQPDEDNDDTPDNTQVDIPPPPVPPAESLPRTPQQVQLENQIRERQQLLQQPGQQPAPPQQQPQ